jgi:hypothetical protein
MFHLYLCPLQYPIDKAAKSVIVDEIKQSTAGKALSKLKEADRARVSVLFRNAQAVIKNNKSLRETFILW